jgi:hypothetical protein
MPTILHMCDIPARSDIDGRALKEIFKHGANFAREKMNYKELKEKDTIKKGISNLKKHGKI